MRFLAAAVISLSLIPAAAAAASPIQVKVTTGTHTPRASAPWPVTIRVLTAGPPPKARLTMRILLGGFEVGKVDNGRVWVFKGTWREPKGQEITWPAASRGQSFVFQAVVKVLGRTFKKNVPVTVT